jgi:hypothetical protein
MWYKSIRGPPTCPPHISVHTFLVLSVGETFGVLALVKTLTEFKVEFRSFAFVSLLSVFIFILLTQTSKVSPLLPRFQLMDLFFFKLMLQT